MTTQETLENLRPEMLLKCNRLAELQNQEKIYLDLSFQSEERWADKQRQNYISSVLRRFVPTPITLAHVDSCAKYCAEQFGTDSDDYKYFDDKRNKGYEYISIDGNNRTRCIAKFFNDEFPLTQKEHKIVGIEHDVYKTWKPGKNNKKYSTLPTYVKEFVDNECRVTCFVVREASLQDLHDLFININDGVQLNAQEKRNAVICTIAEKIREYSKTYEDFFSRYFSKDAMKRRNHEEFMVALLVHITRRFAGPINKSELDSAYNDESPETKNIKKLHDVLKAVNECTKVEKNTTSKHRHIPNEATLFDLCMVVSHLYDKNIVIHDYKGLFEWFVSEYIHIKQRVDENGNPVILWKDSNGQNARDYVGVQRSKDAQHREVRLQCYIELLSELKEGVISEEKDTKRFFSPSIRTSLWIRQDKKCAITGEVILMEQVLDGDVTHIDHNDPHSLGGKTTIDNARLVFKHANLTKSDTVPLTFGTL